MPIALPQHTITETPRVQWELDRLRRLLGARPIDMEELVILGVAAKIDDLRHDEQAVSEAIDRLLRELREGKYDPEEVRLADEAKRLLMPELRDGCDAAA